MKLTIKDGRDHFYTFDTNRILLLTATDEENIRQVEFSTEENGEEVSWTSEVLTGSDGIKYVQVPNEFLNGNYSRLVCYYVALDSNGEFTRQKEIFRIRARQEPQDYYLTYSERVTFASIKALTEQYKATTKQYMDTTEGFKDNAGRSAELASKYAENNEDVAVEPGKYSAKHWSIKAEAAKETAVQKATEAGTSEVNSKTYMESAQSAKQDAETAKNAANTILEQVQSKGTEITNFVATSKAELETQKNESVNAVKSVYQTDLNELKGDLSNQSESLIEIKTVLSEFAQADYIVESGYYDLDTPSIKKDNTSYRCIKMSVKPYDVVKVTADVEASQTLAMMLLYDENFKYKSFVNGKLSERTKFTDYEFIIPNGIRFITVTSLYSAPIVKIASVKQNIATEVTKNTNDISFLKNGNITKKVKNIVTNGNFVGTSNWGAVHSTVSASNNILSITGNGNNAVAISQIVQEIQFDESMRIFVCAKVRVTNDACEYMTIVTASGYYETKIVKPVKDKWYTIATLQSTKRTEKLNLMRFDHAYSDATTANGKVMEVKEVIAFDAMKVFDIVPPLYKLMNIIKYNDWWEGEKEVIIRKIHEEKSINNADNGYLLPTRNAYHSIKRPIVTFVNDDGWQHDYDKLVAISEKHNVPFVSALFDGSTMDEWYELYLQNELGWEFASHPRNDPLTKLQTEEDIENAIIETNEYLTNRGLIYHNLVYPFGEHDERVRRIAKKYYRCACTTDPNGLNKDVVSSFTLHRYPIGYGGTDETNTLANLKAKVDEAVANNSWLIFMLHPQMSAHTDELTQTIDDLITYIKSIGVDILTLNDGYDIFGNALECGDFTGGDTGFAIGFDGARKNI